MRVVRYGMSLPAGHRPGHEPTCSDGAFQASVKSLVGRDAPRSARESFAAAATQSLLAVQENLTEKLGQRKRVQQGFDLLRGLDQLHRELLTSDVSGETLSDISAKLRQLQLDPDEAELAGILSQIELRCAVELAKLSVESAAGDQSGNR